MSEITRDIDNFNERRLKLWFEDSMDRHKMADLNDQQAIQHTMATLMYVLAQAVAITDGSAVEAGDNLTRAIDMIRKIKTAKRKRQEP